MNRFARPLAPIPQNQTLLLGNIRISVLTERILRVEYAPGGVFEDRQTSIVTCRSFAAPAFTADRTDGEGIVIATAAMTVSLRLTDLACTVALPGQPPRAAEGLHPLGGTFRTLDNALGDRVLFGENRGRIVLQDSIFTEEGFTVLDDSASYILCPDGTLEHRAEGTKDFYVLAFGKDYLGGLKEYYSLTGYTPLLPKYALGNWWSRYYDYHQDEYIALMERFAAEQLPFTVATIDMGWHIVKNTPKDAGKTIWFIPRGWTGYTFEKEYFPDHRACFRRLKELGLAITMNLHPHDGIRYYEDCYEAVAKFNGYDPALKTTVPFNLSDKKFLTSYFDLVLRPMERDGVDFWWIDWQQGRDFWGNGFDPLWLNNHYHSLDTAPGAENHMILSRYSGPGSHRYPLGFSGDTIVSWKSLAYQPYFTVMASNTGYSWWSHDIGGHMFSRGSIEIYTRWLQFGVFSPICRLHSTKDKWSKEPWLYGREAESIARKFLQLRHRLLPYLQTANIRTHRDGLPLIMPLYYLHDCPEAYAFTGEYYFGTELLVCPVTQKTKKGQSPLSLYLPEGTWYDIFTGDRFEGGRAFDLQVPMDRLPVFLKAGGFLPLLSDGTANSPSFEHLTLLFAPGEGAYTLEDTCGSLTLTLTEQNGACRITITGSHPEVKTITICPLGKDGHPLPFTVEGPREIELLTEERCAHL